VLQIFWDEPYNAARCEDAPGPYFDDDATAAFALKVIQREQKDRLEQATLYQCNMVRDIYCNSFRPITVDPAWLTATVKHLAEAIYEERSYDRLPILADALEDAGCNQQDILGHLRGGGEHCRGCWVIDLLSGRE
jgi:hypothetical protein